MKKFTSFIVMAMVYCLATFAQWPSDFKPETLIKLGTAQAKMVPGQWYFIHNPRNPGTKATEFAVPGDSIRSAGGFVNDTGGTTYMSGTNIIKELKSSDGVIAGDYSSIIARFVPVQGVEGAYNIQFANGKWMAPQIYTITDDQYQEGLAGMYNFYLVTINGKPNSLGRFAWNKHEMAERVDNNGAGHDVVFWEEGIITGEEYQWTEEEQIKGNNIWQIYDVEFLGGKFTSSSNITSGYYTIDNVIVWNDGDVKSLYSLEEEGAEWLAWGKKEKNAKFLWKIDTISSHPTKYRLTHAYTGKTLPNINENIFIKLTNDGDATFSFELVDNEERDPSSGVITKLPTFLIRKSSQNSDGFHYIHLHGHSNGKGSQGKAIGWREGTASKFYLSPVDEKTAQEWIGNADTPGEDDNEDEDDNENEGDNEQTYDNVIYAQDASANAGSEYVLPILMNNTEEIISFEFELSLPEGITVKQDDRNKYVVTLSEERTGSHQLLTKKMDNGNINIAAYSMSNDAFDGNSGTVVYVTLVIDENIAKGAHSISYNNIVMTKANAIDAFKIGHVESTITINDYLLGDVNGDGKINVTDISGVISIWLGTASDALNKTAADINKDGIINVTDISGVINIFLGNNARRVNVAQSRGTEAYGSMYIDPFSIDAGETVEVLVNLNNPGEELVASEFNLYLPDGIEIATNKRGKYEIAIGSRLDDHQILTKVNNDGSINIAIYSMSNATFWDNEGDILAIKLKAATDISDGTYKLQMKDQILVNTAIEQLTPSNSETKIQVGKETSIHSVNGTESGLPIYDMQGRRTNAKQSGVYIMNNKKIIVR